MRWYVSRNGETVGPVEETQIVEWIRDGMVDAMVRDEAGGAWTPLAQSPFAGLVPKPKAGSPLLQTVPGRHVAIVLGVTGALIWIFFRVAVPSSKSAPAPVVEPISTPRGPSPSELGVEARDTAATILVTHRLACRAAAANGRWDACHDETKGYAALLSCAVAAGKEAKAARAEFPEVNSSSACGRTVASATRDVVVATDEFFVDLVAWLRANQARLSQALASDPLAEVCRKLTCAGLPQSGPGWEGKYEKATFALVNQIECTKPLFQCGRNKDNVCWIGKVASRLGAACDPSENKPDDPLFVRATGVQINRW